MWCKTGALQTWPCPARPADLTRPGPADLTRPSPAWARTTQMRARVTWMGHGRLRSVTGDSDMVIGGQGGPGLGLGHPRADPTLTRSRTP